MLVEIGLRLRIIDDDSHDALSFVLQRSRFLLLTKRSAVVGDGDVDNESCLCTSLVQYCKDIMVYEEEALVDFAEIGEIEKEAEL